MVEVPQSPHLDRGMDVLEVEQGQVPVIRKCEGRSNRQCPSSTDLWVSPWYCSGRSPRPSDQQPQCLDPVAEVPVSAQHQAPTIQAEQKTVELPQFLHLDRVAVEAVVLQRPG